VTLGRGLGSRTISKSLALRQGTGVSGGGFDLP